MLKKLDLEVWTVITWSLLSIGMLVTSLILKKFSYNRKPSVMELLFFLGEYQHFTAAQKKKKKDFAESILSVVHLLQQCHVFCLAAMLFRELFTFSFACLSPDQFLYT